MTEEMVTDEIVTEADSSDAPSAEEFFFGNAEAAEVAGVAGEQDVVEETHGGADTADDAGEPEEPDVVEETHGGPIRRTTPVNRKNRTTKMSWKVRVVRNPPRT